MLILSLRPRRSLMRVPVQSPYYSCMDPMTEPAHDSGSVPAPVYFHNPWYTSWGGFKSDDCTRQALEPLLNMYGADLVYNGEFILTLTVNLALIRP